MRNHLLIIAALVALASGIGAAPPPPPNEPPAKPKPVREIFVPFKDLHVVLDGHDRRVLLSRGQYEELLAKARRAPQVHAPRPAAVTAAEYDLAVADERAVLRGQLEVAVMEEGLHAVPLAVAGVGLRRATLDGQPAPIGQGADGALVLFVEGAGSHQLALEMVAPVPTTAAQQTLQFGLPTPAAARLRLTVPGDVEVRSGAAVIRRTFDEADETTRMELLPVRGEVTLVMTLNSRLLRQQRVVVARSVLVDEVTTAYERLHATISMAVLHRAVDSFDFVVPEGFDVTNVTGPMVARWAIDADDQQRLLHVQLRQPTTETVVFTITAARAAPPLDDWRLPRFTPLDVAGQMSVVGLLLEDRLNAEAVEAQGLIPIDTNVLQQALPASVFIAEPGTAQIRPVVAYYAPQADLTLSARFVKPPARLHVVTNLLLTLNQRRQEVRGGFSLLAEAEKIFGFDMTVPAGWSVQSVTGADDKPLIFERYDRAGGGSRIAVKLPQGLTPRQEQRIYFHAVHVPDNWLAEWQTRPADLPVFAVADAATDVGAVGIAADQDMEVHPDAIDRLSPLDENEKAEFGLAGVASALAYRYDSQPYGATLTVQRLKPRMTARTHSFFRLSSQTLHAHYELAFDVQSARTRKLSLLLPRSTPAALSIRALDNVKLKEYAGVPAGDEAEPMRRWTAVLAEARRGPVRLAVDFEQSRPLDDAEALTLPVVRADGVAHQSGFVSIEGDPELDVQIAAHPRPVDVGELVDATYQPGRRLLGVYAFIGDRPELTVKVTRRPLYGLHPVIVQRAELITRLSATGRAQTAAHYQLRTKAMFIEVALPEGSAFWSAALDGQPIKPQRAGERILLALPADRDDVAVRDLRLVYETPTESVSFWASAGTAAPKLLLHAEGEGATGATAAALEVPVADLIWHVHTPGGYHVVAADGTVRTEQIEPPPLAAVQLAG